jgi:hypothetical protein
MELSAYFWSASCIPTPLSFYESAIEIHSAYAVNSVVMHKECIEFAQYRLSRYKYNHLKDCVIAVFLHDLTIVN